MEATIAIKVDKKKTVYDSNKIVNLIAKATKI